VAVLGLLLACGDHVNDNYGLCEEDFVFTRLPFEGSTGLSGPDVVDWLGRTGQGDVDEFEGENTRVEECVDSLKVGFDVGLESIDGSFVQEGLHGVTVIGTLDTASLGGAHRALRAGGRARPGAVE
jgi:hypothetical protein